jgi:CheY-like chemotaxis protein
MDGYHKSVLVVDDEQVVRVSCERTLRPAGYEVASTHDPHEALRLAEAEPFGLIITDMMMPQMDGLTLVAKLRAMRPEARVLIVTGYATDDARAEADKLGVAYLEKPFTPASLLEAVRALLP